MNDIAAINGPWQAVCFLNFYLTEYGQSPSIKCTVILYEMNDELNTVCMQILSNYKFFIKDILIFSEIKNTQIEKYNTLWIGKLFSVSAKKIVDKFSNLPIILFEEGLHSYIPPKLLTFSYVFKKQTNWKQKLKLLKNYKKEKQKIINTDNSICLKQHLERVSKKYFLVDLGQDDRNSSISSKCLKKIIYETSFKCNAPSFFSHLNKKAVIVVGQCFSNYNLISFEDELELYKYIIQEYLKKQYKVFWKGHPRNTNFDIELKNIFGEEITFIGYNSIPLEILIGNEKNIELSGITSSALIYNSYIFKRETTQISYKIFNKLKKDNIFYDDFYNMAEIIDKYIQRI